MVSSRDIKGILRKISIIIEVNKLHLNELDAIIGDGDHGLNMSKGFKAVVQKIENFTDDDLGNLLKSCGTALINNVDGEAGPLYGIAFMKAGMVLSNKSTMDIKDFIEILQVALDGIKMRGKATEGEKTMIDTLSPALDAGKKALNEGEATKEILLVIRDVAKNGMEHTKNIIATKERASYLGERSLGHQDAGATSMYLILNTITEELLKDM